jgi:hypothetical protein
MSTPVWTYIIKDQLSLLFIKSLTRNLHIRPYMAISCERTFSVTSSTHLIWSHLVRRTQKFLPNLTKFYIVLIICLFVAITLFYRKVVRTRSHLICRFCMIDLIGLVFFILLGVIVLNLNIPYMDISCDRRYFFQSYREVFSHKNVKSLTRNRHIRSYMKISCERLYK